MSEEVFESFDDDDPDRIYRRGDWVYRPRSSWTPAVEDLLRHLEREGFPLAPRVGPSHRDHQVLSYVEGLDGGACWRMIDTDDGLARFARLLRSYHDAVRSYRPPSHARWARGRPGPPGPGELMCHGDFAPWNVVWTERGEPAGIIDWDFAFPGEPSFDVLYAMDWSVPFRDDEACLDFHHFGEVPDRRNRIEIFLDSYGHDALDPGLEVVAGVCGVRRRTASNERELAARGIRPQATWVAAGHLDQVEAVTRWIEEHADLFG